MLYIRSLLFYIIFFSSLIIFSIYILIISIWSNLPTLQRQSSIWIHFINKSLEKICNITLEISGIENLPNKPCIIVANHQGVWESLFIQTLVIPSASIIKEELLYIPFFGWGLAKMQPITINRANKFSSLKKVIKKGSEKLNHGVSIIIFPEGTRSDPIKGINKFNNSYIKLANENNCQIVPICHNSGNFWVNKKFIKRPGLIKMVIGGPILPKPGPETAFKVHTWMKETYQSM